MGKMRFTIESGILGNGKEHVEDIKSECSWLNLNCNVTTSKSLLDKKYHIVIEGEDDKLIKMYKHVENLRNIIN